MSEDEEIEEEQPKRHRFRRTKKPEIMLRECEEYVNAIKRLPKLHSRWLLNSYINCKMFADASIGPHNRMVDELREAERTIRHLQERIAELEQ